jgi:hypothetical protein
MSFAGGARLAVRSTGLVRNQFIDSDHQVEKLWIRLGNKRLGPIAGRRGAVESYLFRKLPRAYSRGTTVSSKASKKSFVWKDPEPLLFIYEFVCEFVYDAENHSYHTRERQIL